MVKVGKGFFIHLNQLIITMKTLTTLFAAIALGGFAFGQTFTDIPVFASPAITNWSGDLDGDNDADLVFVGDAGTDKLYIAEQTSADVFNVVEQPQSHHILSTIRLGDMDNDNDLDIVIADYDDSVYIYINQGSLNFTRQQFYVGDWCSDLELFDADQDDTLDIALASRSLNTLVIYENDNLSFIPHQIDNNNTLINKLCVADVDNNGKDDIYSVGLHGGTGAGSVCRYMNNGSFSFTKNTISSSGQYDIAVGLLDADTDYDFITSNSYNGVNALWDNGGSYNYSSTTLHTLGLGSSALATGFADFDQDNDVDLVFGDEELAGLVVYWNMGAGVYELDTILVDADVYEMQVTDYDNDGDDDILAASYNQGVHLMKNDLLNIGVPSIKHYPINIFPNPTTDKITIELDEAKKGTISLYSLNSEKVLESKLDSKQKTIDCSSLESGLYLLQIDDGMSIRTFQIEVVH